MHVLLFLQRSIERHKLVFTLNLLGLAMGISCAYLTYKWSVDEFTYDAFHPNYNNIYLVQIVDKHLNTSTATPPPLGPALQEQYPEIVRQSRYAYHAGGELLEYRNEKTYAKGIEADASFFEMFHFPMVQGEQTLFFREPNSIILSQELALKLFKNENAVGKTLTFRNEHLLVVRGVFKDIPQNSSVRFDYAVPYTTLYKAGGDEWGMWHPATMIQLNPQASKEEIGSKIRKFSHIHERKERELSLFALRDIHFNLEDGAFFQNYTNYVHLQAMLLMAGFILVVSCLNYTNLSVALFSRRAREVGIKKILGADKPTLILEYLKEVFIGGVMAVALSFALLLLAQQAIYEFTQKEIVGLLQPDSILVFISMGLGIALLAGLYPALFLSSYPPLSLIKRFNSSSAQTFNFRNVLLVGQFAVTILILLCSIIVSRQMSYIRSKDLGYNKNGLLAIPMGRGDLGEKQQGIIQELSSLPGTQQVSIGSFRYMYFDEKVSEWEGKQDESFIKLYAMGTGYDFEQTMGLGMSEGRFFSKEFNEETNLVINRQAARQMNLKEPIGKKVKWRNKQYTIVGVVEDFNYRELSKQIDPIFLFYAPYGDVFVRLQEAKEAPTLRQIGSIWNKHNPAYPFEYHFIEQEVASFYAKESRMESILFTLTGICIFLSGLGLYALSSFTIREKTKDVSIKKILGASLSGLFAELSFPFIKWVTVACLIALPLGIWIMNHWLNSYVYHHQIGMMDIVITLLITVAVTLLAIAGNIVKVSRTNPLQFIRSE